MRSVILSSFMIAGLLWGCGTDQGFSKSYRSSTYESSPYIYVSSTVTCLCSATGGSGTYASPFIMTGISSGSDIELTTSSSSTITNFSCSTVTSMNQSNNGTKTVLYLHFTGSPGASVIGYCSATNSGGTTPFYFQWN